MTEMKVIEENGHYYSAERVKDACECGCGCGMGGAPEPREEARPVAAIKDLYRRVLGERHGSCECGCGCGMGRK